jgi:tRNA (guanine-N7-)-methyltransferase
MSDCHEAQDESGGQNVLGLPQKRYFRQRAHVNPIADHNFKYPFTPDETDWSEYYEFPKNDGDQTPLIRYLDVGCGFGGLLISLASELPPGSLALGMEIRTKVSDYVQKRILALRSQNPGQYGNIWCIRTNAMRYLPNYIHKGQLHKMFFLFPDPHFKKTKHKWRIINDALLAEYAYVCAIGAIVYIATDVSDLFDWMLDHFQRHPLFERLSETELSEDKITELITTSTEESKKVTRNEGDKFRAAFRRVGRK